MNHLFLACKIEDMEARERISRLGTLCEDPSADSPEKILRAAAPANIVIVPFSNQMLIDRRVVDALPKLQLVGTTYGGLRQNVDDLYALERGLSLIHTGPTRVRPMAEYTLALVLSALTRISDYNHAMKSGDAWPRTKFGRTRVLHNRSVGVIGFGLIGQGIVDLFRKFTDKVLVFSEHANAADLERKGLQKAESIHQVFQESEIVILAGGYSPKTHHLIRKEHFEVMRKDALFVNIARGKMVNEAEMVQSVLEREIYLALDVFEKEPLPLESPLRSCERVLLVPHRANAPIEFEERWAFLASELEIFCQGKRPVTATTRERALVMSES